MMEENANSHKAAALFKFLRELSQIKQKTVTHINEYNWHLFACDIRENGYVDFNDRDRTEEDESEEAAPLLTVHKPEFEPCPDAPKGIDDWLKPTWADFKENEPLYAVLYRENGNLTDAATFGEKQQQIVAGLYGTLGRAPTEAEQAEAIQKRGLTVCNLDSDKARAKVCADWLVKRAAWQKRQTEIEGTQTLFRTLYRVYVDLNRESDSLELVAANGFFKAKALGVDVPLLSRRVALTFDALENTICIEDTDVDTVLSATVLQSIEGLNLANINESEGRVKEDDLHPFDRNATDLFLKELMQGISPESRYMGVHDSPLNDNSRFTLCWNPVFILRKKPDGTPRFIGEVIRNIEETGYVPNPIAEIVSGGTVTLPPAEPEPDIARQLAAVGGEDPDILLSKEANREQLEIARRIERYNGVLVQGPPGTGKTHTIANLLGHFLAQGKRVLVTSYTQKALSVLKDKVNENIQGLCVSVMNDSNQDMERSVDAISGRMAVETAASVGQNMERQRRTRIDVMKDLADVRSKMFGLIARENREFELNGLRITPPKAAAFVWNHREDLSYIPGAVTLRAPLPLSVAELQELYESNESLTEAMESEFACNLPATEDLTDPVVFHSLCQAPANLEKASAELTDRCGWVLSSRENGICIQTPFSSFALDMSRMNCLTDAVAYVNTLEQPEEWMIYAAADGKCGGAHGARWETLTAQIERTCQAADAYTALSFGKRIQCPDGKQLTDYAEGILRLAEKNEHNGKLHKVLLALDKPLKALLTEVKINGAEITTADALLLKNGLTLLRERNQCGLYWDQTIACRHGIAFAALDAEEPERVAAKHIPAIQRYTHWAKGEFAQLRNYLQALGFASKDIYQYTSADNDAAQIEKIMLTNRNILPVLLSAMKAAVNAAEAAERIRAQKALLRQGDRSRSMVCTELCSAMAAADSAPYRKAFETFRKLAERQQLMARREQYLAKLAINAPEWAEQIRNRTGIHGAAAVPANVAEAWQWKQYAGVLDEMTSGAYKTLQEKSVKFGKLYRELTAKYAEYAAWYHLLSRTENDISMRQALQGWKQTVRRIGKGTGKQAPKYRAQARILMSKCQEAVPAWIMPMNKVTESLDPCKNHFDIVIVDEASQADITALAVMYLGAKIIIVGDDKQVSPMGIGANIDKQESLAQTYIQGVIPNAHLYNSATSLYDISATTYQPLMLREHFRCVPEIIGFSNGLSYDYKIKPLRDAHSSKLTPAVINCPVPEGERKGKTNLQEALTVVSLMKACFAQEAYRDKSFGVISLLGDEQAELMQNLISANISPAEQEQRRILCGNASHFQGDERDVIFLSMVDAGDEAGPLKLVESGANDNTKKRYNVAVSRARDQLWVVHSLDPAADLKAGDIRKRLIEYAQNPHALDEIRADSAERAESPFEASVATDLKALGYRIEHQWPVGSYRLDLVACDDNRHVAIECDGDRWHSGDEKIREDMERQTVLERAGWRFIRIRGSEYYRNPGVAIRQIVADLAKYKIQPTGNDGVDRKDQTSDLKEQVLEAARQIKPTLNIPRQFERNQP